MRIAAAIVALGVVSTLATAVAEDTVTPPEALLSSRSPRGTGAGASSGADPGYSLSQTNPADDSYYQHVIFNGTNLFFEDVTVCPSGASLQGGRTLTNVHSTLLSGYPSTIYIHNM